MEVQEQSYYAVLNVPPDATEDLIRRAYRQLATTYHPDKHTDSHLQQEASRMFTAVQEAYEVLSDPHKRDIYDVYGKEGLRAGLEVGDRVKTRDELRKEWEQFQKTQEKEKLDAQVNYRGVYIFRVDASALVSPYARNLPRTPEITNIYMTSGVDVPVDSKDWGLLSSDQDALHLGGLVNVRKNVGGGSFLAGYRRAFSDYSTFEVQAAAGLKTLLSATSGVQLSQHAHASLTATWQPMSGVGLQLVTTRQLSEAWNGEYSWVVGPPEASGMSLGLNRRSDKMVLSGRVEVGAMTALVARIVRQLNETTTGRLSVKVSPMGVDVDIGSNKRISEVTTAGASITVGMQGVILKVRYSRAGHLFEFPILLSPTPNPRIIAAAYTIIPLLAYIVRDWVVGPVARLIETRKARSIRRQRAEEVREALAHAAAAAAVMAPVARRRLAKEAQQKGLVVALALYGEENAVRQAADDKPWELRAAALASAGTQTADAAATAASLEAMGSPEGGAGAGSSAGSAAGSRAAELQQGQQGGVGGAAASTACGSSREGTAGAADSGEEGVAGPSGGQLPGVPAQQAQHAQQQGGGGGGGEEDLPPAVADVTTAVQYMVEGSRLVFHRGYSKSGLMGFCDPAPSQAKLLLVYFLHENLPYRAALLDTEGAVLPTRGTLVTDPLEAALVQELAKQQLDRAGPQQQQQQQQQQQRYRTSSAADWIGGEGGGTE